MNITNLDFLNEANILKPSEYKGTSEGGDYRYIVTLKSSRFIIFFEFSEN